VINSGSIDVRWLSQAGWVLTSTCFWLVYLLAHLLGNYPSLLLHRWLSDRESNLLVQSNATLFLGHQRNGLTEDDGPSKLQDMK